MNYYLSVIWTEFDVYNISPDKAFLRITFFLNSDKLKINFYLDLILYWLAFLKWAILDLFFFYFRSFAYKHQNSFYNKLMWKNVHPVYGAGIRTHDLQIACLIP